MQIKTFMVQGTASDVGKSALVTGLCRYYHRRGELVVPFKPQNISLNSAVTADGGEIGRAQAVQARACGLKPHTDMNPVLLKPDSGKTVHVIVHGKLQVNPDASQYLLDQSKAMDAVLKSCRRLGEQYQLMIVEGAGSPAEVNLRSRDIANMGFAEAVDCPVILVGDIDKGGLFAQMIGTLELLNEQDRSRVLGFVINRFRGDINLLQPGIEWLIQKTGKPVLAVLPYLQDLYLEAEDSLDAEQPTGSKGKFNIVVPKFPQMSNHTDFDPLRLHPGVNLEYVSDPSRINGSDLMILPGSKTVRDDLLWLKDAGWDSVILRHLRYGGKMIGICGGFQMLGQGIHDPDGIEGLPGSGQGMALLEMETTLQSCKRVQQVEGQLCLNGEPVKGYEIHTGISYGKALSRRPLLKFPMHMDGAVSDDGQIIGTYVHGLFDLPEARSALLDWAGCSSKQSIDYAGMREQGIDLLADTIEKYFDIALLEEKLGKWGQEVVR